MMVSEKLVEALKRPKGQLHFFNTETREKESFAPARNNHATMYTCGPTVYHFAHIGNFRTYVFEDLLRRTMKFFGHQVTQAMNITDVDDKTIRGAMEAKLSLHEYSQPYKNAFFADIHTLGIERVEHYPCATEYVPLMIDFIAKLLEKGHAYQSKDKSIYFSIEKSPRYGRLSHLKLEQLQVGARGGAVASDEYEKDNVGDFVLWKAYDEARDGSVFWESPFGRGRPGWHLECSAMANHLLGDTLDIHVGAVDNIFPHHENEIAQSEACTGKEFVRFWLHSEHLIVDGKKMSKSLGNFYTLRDLLHKGFDGMTLRYMLMHIHYRTQLNFTFEGIEAAKISMHRINDFIVRMQEEAEKGGPTSEAIEKDLLQAIEKFCTALADDLNISVALAALFDLMHEVNAAAAKGELGSGDAYQVLYVMQEFDRVLGVMTFEHEEGPPEALVKVLAQRQEARAAKDWDLADKLRQEIDASGYVIEDTPKGARLKKK